jgi:hypothetical protein
VHFRRRSAQQKITVGIAMDAMGIANDDNNLVFIYKLLEKVFIKTLKQFLKLKKNE